MNDVRNQEARHESVSSSKPNYARGKMHKRSPTSPVLSNLQPFVTIFESRNQTCHGTNHKIMNCIQNVIKTETYIAKIAYISNTDDVVVCFRSFS